MYVQLFPRKIGLTEEVECADGDIEVWVLDRTRPIRVPKSEVDEYLEKLKIEIAGIETLDFPERDETVRALKRRRQILFDKIGKEADRDGMV